MLGYLRRLVTTGAAYQFGDILAKGLALLTLPLYTHHVAPEGYGAAESLLTVVILTSIFLRLGVGEAFIRFYFDDDDPVRRDRIARTATATVAWTTTAAALLGLAFAGPLSQLILDFRDPELFDCAVLGLWAFTNLEMAYAQLRVDERARTYVIASGVNVGLTVSFTIALVVFANQGARGLLLGNFGASALVVLGLWWVLRRRFSLRIVPADLRAMLAFGLPTVASDASVYALQVADRFYLFRFYSHNAAGLYAVAIKLGDRRVRRGSRLPVRVAAAGLLDRGRRRGRAPVFAGHHLLRPGDRGRGVRGRAAGALDDAPAGCAVLRRLPCAAVAGARLGAVRPLSRLPGDRRARPRDVAQLPAAALGLGAQHRPAPAAGAGQPARASASPARASRCAGPTAGCWW